MLSISCEINSPEMFLKAKIKKLYWAFAWCSLKIPCIDLWQCLRGQILNYLNVGSIKIVRCEVTSLIPSEREASQWVTSPFLLVANLNSNSAFKKKEKEWIAQPSSSDYSYWHAKVIYIRACCDLIPCTDFPVSKMSRKHLPWMFA